MHNFKKYHVQIKKKTLQTVENAVSWFQNLFEKFKILRKCVVCYLKLKFTATKLKCFHMIKYTHLIHTNPDNSEDDI